MMGKPPVSVFEKFKGTYFSLCKAAGLEQYLVPYLMSSHPGATMKDAVEMALWLKKWGYSPEQVQDFYPTPGTISTVMYYTGIHPMTGKPVPVTTDYHEKQLQRALLQFSRPENANLVREALRLAGREDLIGTGADCLVRPAFGRDGKNGSYQKPQSRRAPSPAARQSAKPKSAPRVTAADARKKQTKLTRIFGDDAARILKEADRLGKNDGARSRKKNASDKHAVHTVHKKRGGR
jgi:hypothetical protein